MKVMQRINTGLNAMQWLARRRMIFTPVHSVDNYIIATAAACYGLTVSQCIVISELAIEQTALLESEILGL